MGKPELTAPETDGGVVLLDLDTIEISPERPGRRRYRSPERMEKLKNSIARHGVLQNIIVRPDAGGRYGLIAGEGRVIGSRSVGKKTIPARVLDVDDVTAAMIALVENLVRDDLNAIEETEDTLEVLRMELGESNVAATISTLNRLKNEDYGRIVANGSSREARERVERVFQVLGKKLDWKSFLNVRVPLLDLPEDLKDAIVGERLAYSKGLLLARVENPVERENLMERAIAERMSVSRLKEELERSGTIAARPPEFKRLQEFQKKLKTGRPWEDRERWTKIERLLESIEELLARSGATGER
jgi:ParB family chromosome partitioning protein